MEKVEIEQTNVSSSAPCGHEAANPVFNWVYRIHSCNGHPSVDFYAGG